MTKREKNQSDNSRKSDSPSGSNGPPGQGDAEYNSPPTSYAAEKKKSVSVAMHDMTYNFEKHSVANKKSSGVETKSKEEENPTYNSAGTADSVKIPMPSGKSPSALSVDLPDGQEVRRRSGLGPRGASSRGSRFSHYE